VYRRPDRHWLLQTYIWQDYDLFPNFPALKDFLAFWETKLEGPLFAVTVAHSKLIKPAELAQQLALCPSASTATPFLLHSTCAASRGYEIIKSGNRSAALIATKGVMTFRRSS